MKLKHLESQALKKADNLYPLALAPLVRPQRESDLAALVLADAQPGSSYQLVISSVSYREHVNRAGLCDRCGQSCGDDLRDLIQGSRLETQVPRGLRIAINSVHGRSVVLAQFAENEAIG